MFENAGQDADIIQNLNIAYVHRQNNINCICQNNITICS